MDCSGSIVMPGMINTHTHLFQTLLKGLGDDMELKSWFTCMTGPSAVHLTAEDAKSRRAARLRGIDPLGRHDARRFHVCAHPARHD